MNLTFSCMKNTTLSAGCPTQVSITPSPETFAAGNELTCSADGYDPTYSWTGTAGVNGDTVSGSGDKYTLPEGPFYMICTATVSQLPVPCSASATVDKIAYSKYRKQHYSRRQRPPPLKSHLLPLLSQYCMKFCTFYIQNICGTPFVVSIVKCI